MSCAYTAFFSADPDAKHICIASNCPKDSRKPLALTFPDTSLFIKVVRSLERKIDERLRSSTRRMAANRWHSRRIKLGRPSPSASFPPTIEGFLAVDGGLRISPNSVKTWWPGTELNRRRQPFQGCALPPELPGHFRNPLPAGREGCSLHADFDGIAKRKKTASTPGACGTLLIITTASDSLNVVLVCVVLA